MVDLRARDPTWPRPMGLIHQHKMDAGCSSRNYYYIIY
jgi:hypothetical protein